MSNNSNSTNNVDEEALFADWKRFLVSDRTDLRIAATQAVLEVMTTTTNLSGLLDDETAQIPISTATVPKQFEKSTTATI